MAESTPAPTTWDPENIFKKIIDGVVPSYNIFETEHALAFLDAFPVVPGHALLVPKADGYATVMDLPPDVAANVLRELPRLARAVQAATGATGVNIFQNNGKAAGQVVFHAHFHVIPRFDDDKLIQYPASAKSMIEKDDATAMVERLRAHL